MKIALITIHWANNYGAALQVFASKRYLSRYGCVSVIDYRSKFTSKGMQLVRFGFRVRDIFRIGKDILRMRPRYRVIRKFLDFNLKHLNATFQVKAADDFDIIAKQYDVFVSGSDQIWNPDIVSETGSIDTRYFLDFAKGKKIAYASSMGNYRYSGEKLKELIRHLNSYDAIAVREKDTADYLTALLGRPVAHVLDPTLLLEKQEWLKCFPVVKKIDRPFILVYALKKDDLLRRAVSEVSTILGLKIYAIDQDPIINYSCDCHLMDAGPDEFVQLFSQASFVITNSFHGTAFAVNFNIPFLVTTPPVGINRINSLLCSVALQERIIASAELGKLNTLIRSVLDFSECNIKLNVLRKISESYLNKACRNA